MGLGLDTSRLGWVPGVLVDWVAGSKDGQMHWGDTWESKLGTVARNADSGREGVVGGVGT